MKRNVCSMGGRIVVYDWLRLFATIFVVIGHSAYLNIQTTYGGVAYALPETINPAYYSTLLSFIRWLTGWVYGFHMPLFFMLSGAVLALRSLKSFDYIFKSKVKRLLIPYFVYGWLFMLPIKRLGNFYDNEGLKAAYIGFLSGQDSGHLWFLTALFWCIIIFVSCVKLLEKCKIRSIYAILLISGVLQLTISYIPIDILGMKMGLNYIFYFALGYVFELERQKNKKWNMKKTIVAIAVALLIEIINAKIGILNSFFIIIVGCFFTYLVADIFDRLFPDAGTSTKWNFLIKNLFYVYLLHDPLNYVILRLFINNEWLNSAFGCYAFSLCRTVLIFIVALLMGECIAKLKSALTKVMGDKRVDL